MKMKKAIVLFIIVSSVFYLAACRKTGGNQTENPAGEQAEEIIPEMEKDTAVSYEGEYNDYDNNEPNLEIRKNDDGTYRIRIGIFRLVSMDDCTGHETENGIVFRVNDWDWGDGEISGIITLNEDIATVTFTEGWIDGTNEYQYYRTSDIS